MCFCMNPDVDPNKRKQLIIWGGFILIIVVGMYGLARLGASDTRDPGNSTHAITVDPAEHIRGNKEASATLVEYSDFQCPACAAYYPLVKQIENDFGDGLRIVYRNFPLVSIHKNAFDGAKAAEAANRQGKFWEMHDLLFENQPEWSDESNPKTYFVMYAQSLHLDISQFNTDFADPVIADAIRSQMAGGDALQVHSTPTFFLNGRQLTQPENYEDFKKQVALVVPALSFTTSTPIIQTKKASP